MSRIVTVYSKAGCGQCTVTKAALERAGIQFLTRDVLDGADAAAALETVTSLGYATLPVVTVATHSNHGSIEQHWGGFQPERIKALQNMEASTS